MRALFILLLLNVFITAREVIFTTIDSTDTEVVVNTIILREAYRSLGMDLQLKYYPPERSLLHSNQGDVDGELFRLPVIENKYTNLKRVDVPLGTIDFYVVVADTALTIQDWSDIGNKRVIILRGIKHLQLRTEGMKVTQVSSERKAFYLLQNGRADMYIGVNPRVSLKRAKVEDLYIKYPPIETLTKYHYLHKKNTHLIKPIKAVLEEMLHSGRLQEIRDSVLQSIPQRQK